MTGDALVALSSAQALVGPAETLSGGIIDLGAAAPLDEVTVRMNVSQVSGSNVVLTVEVIAADAPDLSVGFTTLHRRDYQLAEGMNPRTVFAQGYGLGPARRYIRARYTLNGATPGATVTTVVELRIQ